MKWNSQRGSKLGAWIMLAVLACMTHVASAQTGDEVYRITIAKDANDKEGRDYRLMLETLGYIPVYMTGDFAAGKGEVYLGNYPNQKEAQKFKDQLVREGFTPGQIIKTPRNVGGSATGSFTVLAGTFDNQAAAEKEKARLDKAGHLNVSIRNDGGKFLLTVGNFKSPDLAQNVLAQLKDNQGLVGANIVDSIKGDAVVLSGPSDKVTVAEIEEKTGQKLTPEQLKQLDAYLEAKNLKEQKQSKEVSGTVSEEIVRLTEEMQKLKQGLGKVVETVDEIQLSRQKEINSMKKVADLMRDANNLAKGGRTEEALAKIREILAIDPNNAVAMTRERTFQSMLDGEGYEGENKQKEAQYTQLKEMALKSEESNTIPDLVAAKQNWISIQLLNDKYKAEAEGKVSTLDQKIKALQDEQTAILKSGQGGGGNLIYGLIGAVVLLVVVVVFVLYRQNKQKQDILEKLQEATSLRPMRGLPGGGRRQADYGLMAPPGMDGGQTPPGGFQGFDPLGGMPQQQPQQGFGAPAHPSAASAMGATHSVDDLFSSEPEPAPSKPSAAVMPPPPRPAAQPAPAATSSLDDILGSMGSSKPSPAATPSSSLDDILSGIGGTPKTAPAPAAEPTFSPLDDIFNPKPVTAAPKKASIEETSSVSLDDILGIGSSSAPAPEPAKPAASSSASLDDILGLGSTPKKSDAPAPDLSLDALLGGGKPASGPGLDFPQMRTATPLPADSIPAFGGDETIIDPNAAQFANIAGAIPGLGGVRSPASDETIGGPTAVPSGLNGEAFLMNFETDSIGQKPANWSGDFPYATLHVQNDTPPEGSRNYLAYNKKEGVGKVYYSTKFPNTSGVMSVEFDLRCNDKNKFLLGFYIEKDEDFQQSIHTKILRSESQTAPSIHIHGQPAPYLLGTWAKIKYVIDLNEGKVDGYVDGRQVAKAITLPQVPKYLNTLAIRDNINTTGSLFIDNITVKKVS